MVTSQNILVVEDEPLIADDISETLEAHGYQVCAIVDEASDGYLVENLDGKKKSS